MIIFYQFYFVFIFKSCGRNNRSPSGLLFQQIWYISTHLHCCTNDISSYKIIDDFAIICTTIFDKNSNCHFLWQWTDRVCLQVVFTNFCLWVIFFFVKKMYKKSFGWAADDICKMLIPINVQKDEWKFREKLFKKRLNDFFLVIL